MEEGCTFGANQVGGIQAGLICAQYRRFMLVKEKSVGAFN